MSFHKKSMWDNNKSPLISQRESTKRKTKNLFKKLKDNHNNNPSKIRISLMEVKREKSLRNKKKRPNKTIVLLNLIKI
jgi:hypothetical protein